MNRVAITVTIRRLLAIVVVMQGASLLVFLLWTSWQWRLNSQARIDLTVALLLANAPQLEKQILRITGARISFTREIWHETIKANPTTSLSLMHKTPTPDAQNPYPWCSKPLPLMHKTPTPDALKLYPWCTKPLPLMLKTPYPWCTKPLSLMRDYSYFGTYHAPYTRAR